MIGRFKNFSLFLYLAMGWLVIFDIRNVIALFPEEAFIYLALGGFFYTVGAAFLPLGTLVLSSCNLACFCSRRCCSTFSNGGCISCMSMRFIFRILLWVFGGLFLLLILLIFGSSQLEQRQDFDAYKLNFKQKNLELSEHSYKINSGKVYYVKLGIPICLV